MKIVLWVAAAIVVVAALYWLLVVAATRGILRSYRRTPTRVRSELGYSEPGDFNLSGEMLEVQLANDIALRGILFRTQAPRRGLLVYHHGIWDAWRPRLPLAARMLPEGFDVLMYDARGHGASGGRYCTYGAEERKDLSAMLDHLAGLNVDSSRVAVVGHSMGAATAVYTARHDERLKALVLEACYRDLHTAIRDYARALVPFVPESVVRTAERRAQRKGGFDLQSLSPLSHMPHLDLPVLIVQGTRDRRIKPHYAQEHYDALPEPRSLLWIEGARHGRVWHEGGDWYMEQLKQWLTDQMPVVRAETESPTGT